MAGPIRMLLECSFASTVLIIFSPGSLLGCPFCSAVEGDTLLSEVDRANAVVLGILLRQPGESAEDNRKRQAGFGVARIARAGADLTPSSVIDVHLTLSADVGSRHLLLQMGGESGVWRRRHFSPEHWDYACAAAQLPATTEDMPNEDRVRRLVFCLPDLISNSETFSKSAYAEFAAAPYEAVKALAPHLDHVQLKDWIASEERTSAERSLMFTLLGVCGTADDIGFVEQAFEVGINDAGSTELASIIAARLSIMGAEGLDEIERRLLIPKDVASTRRRAAVEALRFHANVDGGSVNRSRLISSARLLLADPYSADLIIRDLADWEDWQSLDRILSLWQNHAEECQWLRQPILYYLHASPLPEAKSRLALIEEPTIRAVSRASTK